MAIDNQWANVSLLLQLSEDLLDVKGHTVTSIGGAALSSAVGNPFGAGSALLLGSGKYLTLSDSADWAFGTGDLLVETWVYPTSFPGGGVGNDMCLFNIPGSPQFFFHIDNTTGKPSLWNGTTGVAGSTALTLNAWNYVAVKRVSSALTIWLGSTQIASSGSYTTNFTPYTGVTVGGVVGSRYLLGYMSQVRITKAGRTITLPSAPFPRPTIKGIVLDDIASPVAKTILVSDRSTQRVLGGANSDATTGIYEFRPWDFGECIVTRLDELCDPMTDECVLNLDPAHGQYGGWAAVENNGVRPNHGITYSGNASVSAGGSSFVFDGSGDRIQGSIVGDTLALEDFDISLEFMPINGGRASGTDNRILGIGADGVAGSLYIMVVGATNPAEIRCDFYDTAYHTIGGSSPTTYANNTWHKLRLRRVSGVFYLEINGTLVSTSAALAYNVTQTALYIGAGSASYFYGNIGKVRISKGPRRAAASISNALLLTGPSDGGSSENALIYDRVIPGG